jgi:predicted secreted protein
MPASLATATRPDTAGATALFSPFSLGPLQLWSGWWLLLVLMPLGVAVLAYDGAVQAALGYAETVYVAFDLHRADLLTALRMDLFG